MRLRPSWPSWGERRSVAARCLEFTILTAVRSGEALGARWEEIDFEKKLWRIPAHRMKSGVEHVVPLSEPALAILVEMYALRESEYVFPGQRRGKPLSNMALRNGAAADGDPECDRPRLPLMLPGLGG